MASEILSVWFTLKMMADYEQRDVFPELRPDQPAFVASGSQYTRYQLTRSQAYAIMEDAIAQCHIDDGSARAGRVRSYGSLLRTLQRACGLALDVYNLRHREPEHDGSCKEVDQLFYRLGIQCGDQESRV